MVTHANSTNFSKEVSNTKGIVVADFWAEWCGPCRRYGPVFEEFAKTNSDKAKFVKVNVEEAQDIAADLMIHSIPTTIFFKNGEPIERIAGIMTKEMLAQKIAQLE